MTTDVKQIGNLVQQKSEFVRALFAEMDKVGTQVALQDIGIERCLFANGLDKVFLVFGIRESTIFLLGDLTIVGEHLPSPTVPADDHHLFGPVKFNPSGILQPEREFIPAPNPPVPPRLPGSC